jgi:hypothetical protein
MTMLKKLVIVVGLTLCAAACAGTPSAPGASASQLAHRPPVGCVTSTTATRLPVPAHECAGFGDAYTQKDVQSTGYTQVNQALSKLDPAVNNTAH